MSYIHAIGMKTLLKSSKNTFLSIFQGSGHFRPIPATNYIGQNRKNREKSPKIAKYSIFQKSMFFYIVAGNMIFGRKSAFWGPESTQKPYIDLPTQYGSN